MEFRLDRWAGDEVWFRGRGLMDRKEGRVTKERMNGRPRKVGLNSRLGWMKGQSDG